ETSLFARSVLAVLHRIMITDKNGGFERILIQTSDSPKDETYTPTALHFSFDNGKKISFTDSFDMFSGLNAFSLHFNRGSCVLAGGNREYKPILSWESTIEHPDSIGFFVTPGGAIAIDDLSLEFSEPDFDNELSCFANPDVLHTYLMRSADPNEGVWKLMDYSLDEDALRTGGEYTLAIIRNGKGYDCYYLNGSRVLPDKWKAGMRKATLLDSGFKNIFDVEWVSATGETISKGIKAQLEGSILTIHFPHQDSNIRLRKLPRN
ncbi:MAG: hypothetical protein K2L89_07840, partial [Muribaculaceae bacterium]|nr:hypothetical protein [Muribaculaceae bacterium]